MKLYQCIYDEKGVWAWNNYKICKSKEEAIKQFTESMPFGWEIKYIFEMGKDVFNKLNEKTK